VNKALNEIVNEHNYFPIKFGINAEKNADSIFGVIETQVQNIPKDLDLLLIPVGSGLIFSGILRGLLKYNIKPKRIVGILSGMDSTKNIETLLTEYGIFRDTQEIDFFDDVKIKLKYELYQSKLKYHQKKIIDEPFSIDPIYEAKSVIWLEDSLKDGTVKKDDKVLMWIVGNQRFMY